MHKGLCMEFEEKIKQLKEKRKSSIEKIYLRSLDEVEIRTPTQFYVIGVDSNGELVIGETKLSPRYVKTISLIGHDIKIPKSLKSELKIGKGTNFLRAKVFAIGRDILIRPIAVPEPELDGYCSWCKKQIVSDPKNTMIRWLGVRFYFCSKKEALMFRNEYILVGKTFKIGQA